MPSAGGVKILAVTLVVVVAAALASSYLLMKPKPERSIRIGVVAPTTGGMSKTGRDMWQAAQLAASEINEAGGVYVEELGRNLSITLYLGDTESTKEGGIAAVTKLVVEDRVDILVGGFSSAITMVDEVVAIEHGVPFIVTGASYPGVTRRTDYDTSNIFHHIATADVFGWRTMVWAAEQLRPKVIEALNLTDDYRLRGGIFYQDSFYGVGAYEGAMAAISELGLPIDIVYEEKYPMLTTDFSGFIPGMLEQKLDFLYWVGFLGETAAGIAQARSAGVDTLFIAVECCDDPDYYELLGRWGEYSILQSRWSTYNEPRGPTHDQIVRFKEAYQEMWGELPSMMAVATYEAVYVAAEAIRMAGTLEKGAVVDALNELRIPQICELIEGGYIDYTEDYRELPIMHFMQQLYFDEEVGECRPRIIYPRGWSNPPGAELELPEWYINYLKG